MSLQSGDVLIERPVCRICYEPCDATVHCKCTGTMKYVHSECLDEWISISNRTTCELCDTPFENKDEDCSQCINRIFYTGVNIMILIFIVVIVVIFIFEIV